MFLLKLNKTACLFSFCVLWICIYELIITVYSRERIRISPAFLKPCLFELQHIYRLNHLLQTVDMHSFSVYRTVQFSAGERHKKKKLPSLSLCPPLCLTAERQRQRGRETERGKGVQIRRGRGQRFWKVSCTAATGRWLSPRKEAEKAEERGKQNERCRGSLLDVLWGELGTKCPKEGKQEMCVFLELLE